MRLPRKKQFDESNPPWLHCISRCVRKTTLCGNGYEHRRQWLEKRVEVLSQLFRVDVLAYAIMSNHLHIVLRPNLAAIAALSDSEVTTSYLSASTRMDIDGSYKTPSELLQQETQTEPGRIATFRKRMGKVSWFMKALKEPLARDANKEDKCTGAFWEGRFKSIPLLDTPAILSCMAYVDLNPLRAGIAENIQDSHNTSVRKRTAAYTAERALPQTASAKAPKSPKSKNHQITETALQPMTQIINNAAWLCDIQQATTELDGLIPGISTQRYLELVDLTARIVHDGKASLHPQATAILKTLDINAERWARAMSSPQSFLGRVIGNTLSLMNEATRCGTQWVQQKCTLFQETESRITFKSDPF